MEQLCTAAHNAGFYVLWHKPVRMCHEPLGCLCPPAYLCLRHDALFDFTCNSSPASWPTYCVCPIRYGGIPLSTHSLTERCTTPQRKFPLAGVHAHPAWPHLGTYEFAATGPCAPPSPPPSLAAKQTDFQPDLAPRKVRFLFIGGTTRHTLNEDVTRKDTATRDKKMKNLRLFFSPPLALRYLCNLTSYAYEIPYRHTDFPRHH